jgi:hypothetical protein
MAHARIIYAAQESPGDVWGRVESTASVGFAFVIGTLVIAGASIGTTMLFVRDEPLSWIVTSATVLAALGELGFLVWIAQVAGCATGRDRVPQLALLQRPWPLLLRPLMVLWWLAHLTIAIEAMLLLERAASFLRETGWAQSAMILALLVFGYFTISHTTHLYAMLAISAGSRRKAWVFLWWRKRFLVDVIVTLVALAYSLRHAFPAAFKSS